jgi:hypothetical protein
MSTGSVPDGIGQSPYPLDSEDDDAWARLAPVNARTATAEAARATGLMVGFMIDLLVGSLSHAW